MMEHRGKYNGAEQRAYDRGWFDGNDDTRGENLSAGFFHGSVIGAVIAAVIAVGLYLLWR